MLCGICDRAALYYTILSKGMILYHGMTVYVCVNIELDMLWYSTRYCEICLAWNCVWQDMVGLYETGSKHMRWASLFQCLRVEPCIYYLCIIICINNPPLKVCFLCRRATSILVVKRVHCGYFAFKPIWAFKHPLLWLNLPILWSSCFCACSLNSVQRLIRGFSCFSHQTVQRASLSFHNQHTDP